MRKKFKRIILFLGFCIAIIYAQAQVIDISTINSKPIITTRVTVLVSDTVVPKGKVLSGAMNTHFKSSGNEPFVFIGYNDSLYWFRFIVSNRADTSMQAVLSLGPTGIKDGELFQRHNGSWKSLGKTGYQYPFKQRPYQYMHYAFPLQVEANSTDTFYYCPNYYYAFKTYGFALGQSAFFKAYENKVYFLFGIIIGLLLLFLVFNLYVYISLRERVHLWYALYIAVQILIVFKNDQLDDQFLGTDSEHGYRMFFLMGIGPLSIGILMHVVQLYLRNIDKKYWLYKVAQIVKWNLVISALIQIIVYYFTAPIPIMNFLFHWAEYSATLGIAVIIVSCIYSTIHGFRSALFILIGLVGFLIGALEKLLLIPTESLLFPPSKFHIGMILEVVIISFGFIYSYRQERRVSQNMQRNFTKEMQNAKQEIQEQTFKTISQEIHDNIGQTLTLAKLTINTIDCDSKQEMNEKITSSGKLLSQAIQDLRNLSRSMNADMILEMGLVSAITYEMELLKKTGTYQIELELEGEEWRLNQQYELIIFRIFQEAISNIIKHAKASKILVQVRYHSKNFELTISDNGIGFDTSTLFNGYSSGLGIRNIQNRAKVLGAQCSIISNLQEGTTITISMQNVEMYKA